MLRVQQIFLITHRFFCLHIYIYTRFWARIIEILRFLSRLVPLFFHFKWNPPTHSKLIYTSISIFAFIFFFFTFSIRLKFNNQLVTIIDIPKCFFFFHFIILRHRGAKWKRRTMLTQFARYSVLIRFRSRDSVLN